MNWVRVYASADHDAKVTCYSGDAVIWQGTVSSGNVWLSQLGQYQVFKDGNRILLDGNVVIEWLVKPPADPPPDDDNSKKPWERGEDPVEVTQQEVDGPGEGTEVPNE